MGHVTCKVLLMTQNDRYQPYLMEVVDNVLIFYRTQHDEKGAITQELGTFRISSIDTATKKTLCKSRRHYGVTMATKKGHRKLYFLTHDQLKIGLDFLMEAMGHTDRLDQYSVESEVPATGVYSVRKLVVHKSTSEHFELKSVLKREVGSAAELQLVYNELLVAQTVNAHNKLFLCLVDYVEDNNMVTLVYSHQPKTLREDILASNGSTPFAEQDAAIVVCQVAASIAKLHSRNIAHRDLRMEAVRVVRKRDSARLLLSDFDFAITLKKDHMVT
jgi:hypothetical protein